MTVTKKSIGFSVGVKGARVGINSQGRSHLGLSLGGGLRYDKQSSLLSQGQESREITFQDGVCVGFDVPRGFVCWQFKEKVKLSEPVQTPLGSRVKILHPILALKFSNGRVVDFRLLGASCYSGEVFGVSQITEMPWHELFKAEYENCSAFRDLHCQTELTSSHTESTKPKKREIEFGQATEPQREFMQDIFDAEDHFPSSDKSTGEDVFCEEDHYG